MNYYKVIAKCGHVGKGHYIIKDFYVMAGDGKEAALKVRWFPRVKHHWKNAIEKVCKITKEEYDLGLLKTQQDIYFHVRNSTEQRIYVGIDLDEVYEREVPEKKRRDKSFVYYVRIEKIRDIGIISMALLSRLEVSTLSWIAIKRIPNAGNT